MAGSNNDKTNVHGRRNENSEDSNAKFDLLIDFIRCNREPSQEDDQLAISYEGGDPNALEDYFRGAFPNNCFALLVAQGTKGSEEDFALLHNAGVTEEGKIFAFKSWRNLNTAVEIDKSILTEPMSKLNFTKRKLKKNIGKRKKIMENHAKSRKTNENY